MSETFDRNVFVLPQKHAIKRVGIYCRVSSTKQEQIRSLAAQISGLTRIVYENEDWKLYDVYIDIKSGSSALSRDGFQRMLSDCSDGLIDVVLVKSVSRLGRNTVDVLTAVQAIVDKGVLIQFDAENFCSNNPATRMYVAAATAAAQAENEMRSNNVLFGIEQRVKDGTSTLYDRKCYGYKNGEDGRLEIVPEEADIVRNIFDWYLSGYSILKIVKELAANHIVSPTRKERWAKRTIDCMLSNEKYTGRVVVMKNQSGRLHTDRPPSQMFESENNNPVIITKETFAAVQEEKARRSNVIRDENGTHRKSSKFSSKTKSSNE